MPYKKPNSADIACRGEAVAALHGRADTLDRALSYKGEVPGSLVPRATVQISREGQASRGGKAKSDGKTASRLGGRVRRAL